MYHHFWIFAALLCSFGLSAQTRNDHFIEITASDTIQIMAEQVVLAVTIEGAYNVQDPDGMESDAENRYLRQERESRAQSEVSLLELLNMEGLVYESQRNDASLERGVVPSKQYLITFTRLDRLKSVVSRISDIKFCTPYIADKITASKKTAEREASRRAFAMAKQKAEALGNIAGVNVGKAIMIKEEFTPAETEEGLYYRTQGYPAYNGQIQGSKMTTIEPGDLKIVIKSTLTVRFAIE